MRWARISYKWLWVGFTVLATTLAVLLIANLTLGDKRIDQRVAALYPVSDAQFRRSMNVLFGPPLVGGNRVQPQTGIDHIT